MKFVYNLFPDFNEPEKCDTLIVRLFAEDGKTIEKCHIFRTVEGEFKACSKFYGDSPIHTRVGNMEEARVWMEQLWSENYEQITDAYDAAGQRHGGGPWERVPFVPDYIKMSAMQDKD